MCIVAGCGFFWVGKSIFNCVILVYHRWFFESMFSLLFLTEFVGSICLYAALLFFGLKNKIPAIIKVSPEKLKSKIEKKPPAVALNELKKKLDNKEISTEEYESWRADILNKL